MTDYARPLPKPTPTSRPFWEAARRHELWLQRCPACAAFVHYPRERCPRCLAGGLKWVRASGRAVLYSYTVVHRAQSRAFADAPYILAIVELEEGARMTTNIVAAPEALRVGMPLAVFFDDVTPEVTLVKFKPA